MIATNVQIQAQVCLYLTMILMTSQTLAFVHFQSTSKTHQDITRDAILQTTADICKFLTDLRGQKFNLAELTVKSVADACSSSDSGKDFQISIDKINSHNAQVDVDQEFSPQYHFDSESFQSGRDLITKGIYAVKQSVEQQSYETARTELGKILHTLQDFYSHSNWIELGKTEPYSNLIKPDTPINNIADSETCRNCNSDVCTGNILDKVIAQQKLTSGYSGIFKPKGKCSHGGTSDLTTWGQGGINKDELTSSHGHLHEAAASVATAASKELLQDIRATVGDSKFLRLMGLSQALVLCFVIDTTGSMSNDIATVRFNTSSIIHSRIGTAAEPSEYILVPFNDPGYGPPIRTADPNVFEQLIYNLTAAGGGDEPEMCLSGLLLALIVAPPQTEIFVFTDAGAKDTWLNNTVQALIEKTKSKVSFMLTNALGPGRRRRSASAIDGKQQVSTRILNPSNQLYQNLAQASGGQAIEVTKATLGQATDIIAATSISTLVTLFQAIRNPAKAENFSVFVDSSVQNLTIYITGNSPKFLITSPSGVSQSSAELNGPLGLMKNVGNFYTVQPNISAQTGLWLFSINSTQLYTIRVVGQSKIDFIFDFVELFHGSHPSYAVLNSRPAANNNLTLLVSMIGGDSVTPTAVSLVEASSSNSFNGTLEKVNSGQYLVTFNSTPGGEFTVRVTGQIGTSKTLDNTFQRQIPTQFQTSPVTITTQPVGTVEPGKQFTLPFTVATTGSGGSFNISVSNDRSFNTLFNTSLTLESGGSANGTVALTVPANASSGTDVTVTIQAEAPGGSNFNYAVLRLAVIAPVTDLSSPVCEAVSVNANCSANCSLSSWSLTTNVTDGNGSGVQNIRILQGNGNLTTTTVLSDKGVNVTMVVYNSSCCSPDLELVAVDKVGNVATCYKTVRATAPITSTVPPVMANSTSTINTTTTATSRPTTSKASIINVECCSFLPLFLCLNVCVSLYQLMQH
ncbi:von Willebrand factor A domain-containing protein 7-like [Clarias gariepinus]